MTRKGLEPDKVTYNTVIRALCRAGRLKALDGILERMRRSGISPDRYSFYLVFNQFRHATATDILRFLKIAEECGVTIDRDHGAKLGPWMRDRTVMGWFRKRGLDPDNLPEPPQKHRGGFGNVARGKGSLGMRGGFGNVAGGKGGRGKGHYNGNHGGGSGGGNHGSKGGVVRSDEGRGRRVVQTVPEDSLRNLQMQKMQKKKQEAELLRARAEHAKAKAVQRQNFVRWVRSLIAHVAEENRISNSLAEMEGADDDDWETAWD